MIFFRAISNSVPYPIGNFLLSENQNTRHQLQKIADISLQYFAKPPSFSYKSKIFTFSSGYSEE